MMRTKGRAWSGALWAAACGILVALGAACGGSGGSREDPRLADEGREVFASPAARSGGGTRGPGAAGGEWSIILVGYQGEGAKEAAAEIAQRVRTTGGLPEAYVEEHGKSWVVAYGRYRDATAPAAIADLQRIKDLVINNQKPFAAAVLAPPENIPGSQPEFDLRQVKGRMGDWALYSLQVGVYGREDMGRPTAAELAQYRQAAEQAVVQLRREGDPAYYYHGTTSSMVTVGVFGEDDFDPATPGLESPLLVRMRTKYPHNLLNGKALRERMPGLPPNHPDPYRLQPSRLVAIPSR